jgi:putative membrane protein
MGMYEGYHFWGMHAIWWIMWIIILFSIFTTPYHFPKNATKREKALETLKKRFALGQISTEQYLQYKTTLKKNKE